MRESDTKLRIEDFTFDCQTNGDLYVSADVLFNQNTFTYDEETGLLYFNNDAIWQGDYFYLSGQDYVYFGGTEQNV